MKLIATLVGIFFVQILSAQVNGIVWGSDKKDKEAIFGAKVKLLKSKKGVVTGEDGTFELILPKELPDTMVISAMGFLSDTIVVDKKDRFGAFEITLYSDQLLPEVVIKLRRETHSISRLKILAVEELTSGELRKAACCNLSESFETNASVDVNITDAVSGAKKIQMMGLDGVYTQIQLENIPYLRGLETSFGLTSIPGTWVNSIQITKGAGNAVNGFESMAGLVNIELKKPENMERIYVNGYVNRMARSELNFNTGFKLSDKWSTGWFAHGSIMPLVMDGNNDGFRDVQNGTNLAVFNRYKYEGDKMESMIGINAHWEDKVGGQVVYRGQPQNGVFGVDLDARHLSGFVKTGFFLKKPLTSIGVIYHAKYQEVATRMGDRAFNGRERRGYINASYDGIIDNSMHKFKLGVSGVYSDLMQRLDSLNDDRLEVIPGAFGEYTYGGPRLSVVVGARADWHNMFDWQFSPRLHAKYAVSEYTDVRVTGGKGWRVPNYMIDNVSLMATSRAWITPDTVRPEISWNVGGSLVQRFKLFNHKASFVLDFYHTRFENQLVVDRDADFGAFVFDYIQGESYSNALQAELSIEPFDRFDIRVAYKWLDVKSRFGGELQQRVMTPNHRGLVNLSYRTRNKRWEYDLTTSIFGNSRLPVNLLPDGSFTTENVSPIYPVVNAQITYVYKKWDIYLGGENLTNSIQQNPIIDAENPFSSSFDATRVWGPIFGMQVYLGFRFSIDQPKEKE